MGYIKDYIQCVIGDLLQFINYRIINSSSNLNKIGILKDVYQELDKLNGLMDIQIDRQRAKEKKCEDLTAEKVTRYFSCYRTHCSRLEEELKILEVLKSEIDEDKKRKLINRYFAI